MLKYLQDLPNSFDDQLNRDLMNKTSDEPLVSYLIDAWKSLEVAPPIHIIKTEYNPKESDVDVNKYIFKRDKKKKKKEKFDYKYINDDRCGTLTVWVDITLPVKDPKTGKINIEKKIIKKSILVPLIDKDGYMHIRGKRYYMIYQIVEKSTYTGSQTVTLKSLMPVAVKRVGLTTTGYSSKLEEVMNNGYDGAMRKSDNIQYDIYGIEYNLPLFTVFMFKKEVNVLLFYLALNVEWALDFLKVSHIISFENEINKEDTNSIWFQISSKCYLRVKHKSMFDKYAYIRGIVGSLLDLVTNRMTSEQIYDTDIWIKRLGGQTNANAMNKGKDMLTFFNRLLDVTTKKILKIDKIHKKDIYSLIRWMMMNFNTLRSKDNLNLYNKRLRCGEYISSLLTIEFSRRLNRVISKGSKADMITYRDLFKFPGDILLQKLHSSGILRFDDNINDMSFYSKFKVTFKGRIK